MKTKLRIGVDVDDVLLKTLKLWMEELDKKYKTGLSYKDIDDWDLEQFFPQLTSQQIIEPLTKKKFFKKVVPVKDSIKYLYKLYKDGHDIYLITATDYRNVKNKFNAVLKYFPFLDTRNFISCNDKSMIIGIDVMIDDYEDNLDRMSASIRKFLFKAPHNKKSKKKRYSWKKIYKELS